MEGRRNEVGQSGVLDRSDRRKKTYRGDREVVSPDLAVFSAFKKFSFESAGYEVCLKARSAAGGGRGERRTNELSWLIPME